jgi:hypothetical protein
LTNAWNDPLVCCHGSHLVTHTDSCQDVSEIIQV